MNIWKTEDNTLERIVSVLTNFRFEKRHKNMSVHLSPCFRDVMVGDVVTVGECRYVHQMGMFISLNL